MTPDLPSTLPQWLPTAPIYLLHMTSRTVAMTEATDIVHLRVWLGMELAAAEVGWGGEEGDADFLLLMPPPHFTSIALHLFLLEFLHLFFWMLLSLRVASLFSSGSPPSCFGWKLVLVLGGNEERLRTALRLVCGGFGLWCGGQTNELAVNCLEAGEWLALFTSSHAIFTSLPLGFRWWLLVLRALRSFLAQNSNGTCNRTRVNDASDSAETAAIQNGMYVSVIGCLKGLQERKRATVFSIRLVTDFNEVTLHFIQCVRMHLENTKSKVSGPAQNNSVMGTSISNGFSESSTPTSSKSNPAPVTSGTNGSETDLYTKVLNVFREPANVESEHGVHIDEIAKRLRLPASKIKEAIEYHVDVGHIYSTIDDFHFKSAFID